MSFEDFCIVLQENQSFFSHLQGCMSILFFSTIVSTACLIITSQQDSTSNDLYTTLLVIVLLNGIFFVLSTSLYVVVNITVSRSTKYSSNHAYDIKKLTTTTSAFLVDQNRTELSPPVSLLDQKISTIHLVTPKPSSTLSAPSCTTATCGRRHSSESHLSNSQINLGQELSPGTHRKCCGCPGRRGSSICPEHESGKVRLAVRRSTLTPPCTPRTTETYGRKHSSQSRLSNNSQSNLSVSNDLSPGIQRKRCGCPWKKGSFICPDHPSGKVRLAVRKSTTARPPGSQLQLSNLEVRNQDTLKPVSPVGNSMV